MPDDVEHFVLIDRLLEKGNRAGGQGLVAELRRFTAGDENNGSFPDFIDAAEPVEYEKAVPGDAAGSRNVGGEIDVENDKVGAFAAHATDGGRAVHGGADFVTGGFEFDGHGFKDNDVVIRDQDFRDMRPDGAGGRFRCERQ